MEKVNPIYRSFQKKITPYLDGALNPEEQSEFEAFVSTHPEFESVVRGKEAEIELLRSMIPQVSLSEEALDSLSSEMRSSIFNLIKDEPKGFWDNLRIKFEEWLNR